MKQLSEMVLGARRDAPGPMLRRMKGDELDGLREKKIHVRKRQMPDEQARIYADIVTRAKEPDSGPMLETLHLLRGVSLHPIWPPAGRLEAAADRAIDIGARTYGSVKSILDNHLDLRPAQQRLTHRTPIRHSNIRG